MTKYIVSVLMALLPFLAPPAQAQVTFFEGRRSNPSFMASWAQGAPYTIHNFDWMSMPGYPRYPPGTLDHLGWGIDNLDPFVVSTIASQPVQEVMFPQHVSIPILARVKPMNPSAAYGLAYSGVTNILAPLYTNFRILKVRLANGELHAHKFNLGHINTSAIPPGWTMYGFRTTVPWTEAWIEANPNYLLPGMPANGVVCALRFIFVLSDTVPPQAPASVMPGSHKTVSGATLVNEKLVTEKLVNETFGEEKLGTAPAPSLPGVGPHGFPPFDRPPQRRRRVVTTDE